MPGTVIRVACLTLFLSTGSIMFIWMPTDLTHIVKPGVQDALLITTLTMALMIAMQLVGGAISDRLGRRTLFVASGLGWVLLSYPLFLWLDGATMLSAIGTGIIFAVLLGVYSGSPAGGDGRGFSDRREWSLAFARHGADCNNSRHRGPGLLSDRAGWNRLCCCHRSARAPW